MKLVRRTGPEPGPAEITGQPPWRILVVDDEPDVHAVTALSLRDFRYAGRKTELLGAFSGGEARDILEHEPDIAVALIDVVMESDDAGLRLVEYIRGTLGNQMMRLVIRTGQPGVAPEREVIDSYDIDGYKDKSELTAQKLYTTVRSALKAWHDLRVIDANRKGLIRILNATPQLYLHRVEEMEVFFSGVLMQVAALCNLEGIMVASLDGFVATVGKKPEIRASIGNFNGPDGAGRALEVHRRWASTLLAGNDVAVLPDHIVLTPLAISGKPVGYIYLEGVAGLGDNDRHLIQVMANQVSAALQSLSLREDLKEANSQALYMLAEASEYKDEDTGSHLHRMRRGTVLLAQTCGLDAELATGFGEAAILHDVGKMGIPDQILQKPARLTADEYEVMKRHTLIGESILGRSRWLQLSRDCAVSHHEHWNGAGYPHGLRGEDIPLIGRIVAVMDVFDALAHRRPYKPAWPLEDVVAEISRCAGTQFDPKVVEAFLTLHRSGRLPELL